MSKKFESREEVLSWVALHIFDKNSCFHCGDCFRILNTMEEMYIPPDGSGLYCEKCYQIERAEEVARLREENRKLQLSFDKAMVVVRANAPKIKSALEILHELEQAELSHDVEYIRKLRDAVKVERAMELHFLTKKTLAAMIEAWNHCGNKIRDECLERAESELRAEGVIE